MTLEGVQMTSVPHRHEPLSPRERRILKLVVDGCTNEEIAARVHLSTQTVKNQVSALMAKLGVRNRVQLAVYGVRNGLTG
jgi:DNA-binding NarL/FixJ family response regulator